MSGFTMVPAEALQDPRKQAEVQGAFNLIPVESFHMHVQVPQPQTFQFVPVMEGFAPNQAKLSVSNPMDDDDLPTVRPHKGSIKTQRDVGGAMTFRFVPNGDADDEEEFEFVGVVRDDQGQESAVIPKAQKLAEIGENLKKGFTNSISKLGSLLNLFALNDVMEENEKTERSSKEGSDSGKDDTSRTLHGNSDADEKEVVVVAEADGGSQTMVVTSSGNHFLVTIPDDVKKGESFKVSLDED